MSAFQIVRFLYIALMLSLLLVDFFIDIHILYYLVPTLVFVVLLAWGSADIGLNFFLKAQSALQTDQKVIALSFDDGPSAEYTPAILDLLDAYSAKATFFCIGHRIEKNEELLKTIVEKGHRVGNHSYSHSNFFSFFGTKKIMNEIRKTNSLIHRVSGQECEIFRPPYGVTNPPIAKAVKKCGMKVIGWNLRSLDTSTQDYHKVIDRVLKRIKAGSVILLHDDRQNTPKILEAILLYARQNNYQYALLHEPQN
ncbi:polysaccharide deacetylase family protein [Catalinimonas niigatensis]|uniref:polysaccharide deacetylase family protein n=1 Tax=Catalinimonas niigatensis TaxID=1397264 RepID=UPI002666263A|nr:polysaccharide deacetylase family protein [Catalinimonas niigatensis]WPP48767.1 polysaccharide deacetylase family protein [Catalinimonas niigatensis]